jgi:hypothetical protein
LAIFDVAMVTGNLRLSMPLQRLWSTFVPSLMNIETYFIVSLQFELVTRGFSMKKPFFTKCSLYKINDTQGGVNFDPLCIIYRIL